MCEQCRANDNINKSAANGPTVKSRFTTAPKNVRKTVAPRPVSRTVAPRPVTKTRSPVEQPKPTGRPTSRPTPTSKSTPAPKVKRDIAPTRPKPTITKTRYPNPKTPARPTGRPTSRPSPSPSRGRPTPKGPSSGGGSGKGKPFPENQRERSLPLLQDLYDNGYTKVKWVLSPGACDVCNNAKNKWDNADLKDFIEGTSYDAPLWSRSHPRCRCYIQVTSPDRENPPVKVDWQGVV